MKLRMDPAKRWTLPRAPQRREQREHAETGRAHNPGKNLGTKKQKYAMSNAKLTVATS